MLRISLTQRNIGSSGPWGKSLIIAVAAFAMAIGAVGAASALSLFGSSQKPQEALNLFVQAFTSGDAKGLAKLIQPEIAKAKEIDESTIRRFLERYDSTRQKPVSMRLLRRLKSKDGDTERIEVSLVFQGPPLSKDYPQSPELNMKLLWVKGKEGRWWYERPLEFHYVLKSDARYPTPDQQALGLRFKTALNKLQKLGLPGKEDIELASVPVKGVAVESYRELVELHKTEHGDKGVSRKARGVDVLLSAAKKERGGFLKAYHGDFKLGAGDKRKPMPWDVLRDYVVAAINRAKYEDRLGHTDKAEDIYRRIISVGRQILDEPGGLQFVMWGLTFELQGARGLADILERKGDESRKKAVTFIRLASRRLDLLKTAQQCLDELEGFNSMQAAIIAATEADDPNFKPWGINTLAILSLKGAPAERSLLDKTGALVIIRNPDMERRAAKELDRIAASGPGGLQAFVSYQRKWIQDNKVYGSVETLKRQAMAR